jgi:hypothetical protein
MPPLGTAAQGYSDARATPPDAAFDFSRKPRAFVPIAAHYPASFFENAPASGRAPDDQ